MAAIMNEGNGCQRQFLKWTTYSNLVSVGSMVSGDFNIPPVNFYPKKRAICIIGIKQLN
jgi:hypothetical protein